MTPDPIIFISNSRADRIAAVRRHLVTLLPARPADAEAALVEDASAPSWPFQRQVTPGGELPRARRIIWIRDLHLAFPAGQSAGARLVLTQSTYQLQRWLDWLDSAPLVSLVADACHDELSSSSSEAFARRGPWARFDLQTIDTVADDRELTPDIPLHAAFRQPNAERRLDACRGAVETSPDNPAIHLALASVCMELRQLDDAQAALERAVALAPSWEAAHFEIGKLWLRANETERAAVAFTEAVGRMPTFAAAWSNLGAALGELDRGDEALAALVRARTLDPRGHAILNNIGAVHRDAGRLDEAAAAFREVIALAPDFVVGSYNLGHTLFLAGRFEEARRAYEEAFARDPQKNARQACRLAIARAAAADTEGAVELLDALAAGLPDDQSRELFEEAERTLDALAAAAAITERAAARLRAALRPYR